MSPAVVGSPAKVDLMTVDPTGRVILIMTQVEEWDDSDDQLLAVQAKINSYVSFLLDGQARQAYPNIDVSRWAIRVDCQTSPPPRMSAFLDALGAAVTGEGGGFEWGLL